MNYPSNLDSRQRITGWVLAAGHSRRMGQDKARLRVGDEILLVRIARQVAAVCGKTEVLSPLERYSDLGFAGIPDRREGCGPLGGLETALLASATDWNLVVACDMPNLEEEWLSRLIERALASPEGVLCVASEHPERGPSPLCAVWHRDALPQVQKALNEGNFRVRDVLAAIPRAFLAPERREILANWNEPGDVGTNA